MIVKKDLEILASHLRTALNRMSNSPANNGDTQLGFYWAYDGIVSALKASNPKFSEEKFAKRVF